MLYKSIRFSTFYILSILKPYTNAWCLKMKMPSKNKKEMLGQAKHIAKLLVIFPWSVYAMIRILTHDFDKDAAREMDMSVKEYKRMKKGVKA